MAVTKNAINKDVFGRRLKQLMDTYHENTYSMGKTFNLSPPSISRYTRGEMAPKMTTIQQMAAYFDVSAQWLMGLSVPMYDEAIVDETALFVESYSDVAIFKKIRYDLPVFSNERLEDTLRIPLNQLASWGPCFAYAMADDSMAPTIKKGSQIILKLSTSMEPGMAMGVHVNRGEMVIRKVVLQDHFIILQPHNPKYDAQCYDLRKDEVQIIGTVVYEKNTAHQYFNHE